MDNDNNDEQINNLITDVKEFINKNYDNDNNLNIVCIYEPIQYNYLWYTSWLFFVTTCYSACKPTCEFIIAPGSIFLTSINYWKKPIHNSWERNLDIMCVFFFIGYNIIRSIGAEYASKFYLYLSLGFSSYLISNYNHKRKRLYVSALFHSLVHLYCNVGLMYLYSGQITLSSENYIIRNFWNICENLVD